MTTGTPRHKHDQLRRHRAGNAADRGFAFGAVFAVVAGASVLAVFACIHLGLFLHRQVLEQEQQDRAAVQEFVNEVRLQCERAFPLSGERRGQCLVRILQLAEVAP